ncbi:MAG: tetratricopeptide repeat protein [Bellilinea sp.]
MKLLERLLLSVLVAAPVLVSGLVSLAPRPVRLTAAWQRAHISETIGMPAEAARYYRQVLEYQPERTDLLERIAGLEFLAGDYTQAIASYGTAMEHGEISAGGLLNLGDAYLQTDDSAKAREIWGKLASLPAVETDQMALAADRLRAAGDLDGTLLAALRWLELEPKSVQAAWLTGMLLSPRSIADAARPLASAGNGEGAEAEQSRRLLEVLGQAALQNDRAYQLVLIGQRLGELGQWDVAETAFQAALNLAPEYAEAWAFLGESRQQRGKDGWTALLRAKSIASNSDIVLSALTLYWGRQNKPMVALQYLQKLAANHPDQGRWQVEIGGTYAQAGDLVSAMAAYQRAVEIEPINAQFWRALAVFSATYGFDFDAFSQPAIERALILASKDLLVLDAAGWVYLTHGDLEKAEQFLQLALAEDGEFEAAQFHLAQVYIAGNRFSLAFPLLKTAAVQNADPAVASQAQRLLDKHFPGQ